MLVSQAKMTRTKKTDTLNEISSYNDLRSVFSDIEIKSAESKGWQLHIATMFAFPKSDEKRQASSVVFYSVLSFIHAPYPVSLKDGICHACP